MSFVKPSLPTLKVNGHIYVKVPDLDCLRVSFYQCKEIRKQIRLEWLEVLERYVVHGTDMPFTLPKDITVNLQVPERCLETYLTPVEDRALDKIITQAMLASEK